jgi:hypothetical protein
MQAYTLMCLDEPLLDFEVVKNSIGGILKVYNENIRLLPEILKMNPGVSPLTEWLLTRQLDTTRSNARLLLKLLKLGTGSNLSVILFNNGLSLTDSYWIKRKEDKSLYDEISFYDKEHIQPIVDTSLSGALHELPKYSNPELTNIGSFNKAWKKEGGTWWLYKAGSPMNYYAELFAYYLGEALGMDMAYYEYRDGLIRTKNMTSKEVMLEHFASFVYSFGEIESDDVVRYNHLKELGIHKAYADILFLDGLVCNPDRHEYNIAVQKSTLTGALIGIAPNFDNNLAFNAGTSSKPSTYLLKLYLKEIGLLDHQRAYVQKLNKELFKEIDDKVKVQMQCLLDTEFIMDYLAQVLDILEEIK